MSKKKKDDKKGIFNKVSGGVKTTLKNLPVTAATAPFATFIPGSHLLALPVTLTADAGLALWRRGRNKTQAKKNNKYMPKPK